MSAFPCACGGKHIKPLRWQIMAEGHLRNIIEIADGGLFQYEIVGASAAGTHDVLFWAHGREQCSQAATGHGSIADARHWAQKHHESKLNQLLEG